MPLWGTRQSGCNPDSRLNFTMLIPGDDLTLLDGTEAVVTGSKSLVWARGEGLVGTDAGSTYVINGCANGTVIGIQSSNGTPLYVNGVYSPMTFDGLDASFETELGGEITGNGSYTDPGRSRFYRLIVVTFVAGDAPVVIVQR